MRRTFLLSILLTVLIGAGIYLRCLGTELNHTLSEGADVVVLRGNHSVGASDDPNSLSPSTTTRPTAAIATTSSWTLPTVTPTSTTPTMTTTPSPLLLLPSSNKHTHLLPKKLPVYIWTNDKAIHNEMKHFVVDGVERSPYLERVYSNDTHYNNNNNNNDTKLLWLADTGTGKRPSRWCEALVEAVQERLKQTHQQQFPLYICHWGDDPYMPIEFQHCDALYDLLGLSNIRYFKRSMVVERHWNATTNTTVLGRIDPNYQSNYSFWSGRPIQHVSYGVRSDTVEGIAAFLQEEYNITDYDKGNVDLASILPRPNDVAHFWPPPDIPVDGKVDRGGRFQHNSMLRDAVSQAIWDWNATRYPDVTGFAGLAGAANLMGRNDVQESYVRALLSYKIVVVAQKDNWEGHYRLMEALSSGALVLTDRMLLLPEGLVDGNSVVVYDNVTDMLTKVEHYLWRVPRKEREAIAREGWRIAMTRHRSWHIMERVLFGRVVSS